MRTTLKVRKMCGAGKGTRCAFASEACQHTWTYDPMVNGRRVGLVAIDDYAFARHGPRHVRTEAQAEQWAARILNDWVTGADPRQSPAEQARAALPPPPPPAKIVAELVAAYRVAYHLDDLAHLERATLKHPQVVLSELRHITGFCGTWPVKDLEHEASVREFEKALYEGWTPIDGKVVERGDSGVRHLLVRLRTIIRFGMFQHPHWLERSPFHKHGGVQLVDELGRKRRLEDGELEALLDACRAIDNADHQFAGRYLRRRILGAVETGGRGSELNRVRVREHVTLTKVACAITYLGRKDGGGKSMDSREVPFEPGGLLALELEKCRFWKAPHDRAFGNDAGDIVSQYKAWVTVQLLAHGKIRADGVGRTPEADREALAAVDLQFRDLRRECASRWRDRGMDVREIQILLGHSTLLMTVKYLQLPKGDNLSGKLGQVMGWQ